MELRTIKQKAYEVVDVVLHLMPVRKNWIIFTSFWGQYNDNPKYISEELHRRNIPVKIFWGISKERSKEKIPSYVKVCKYNSLKYLWYKNRCAVVVDNIIGDYSMYGKNVAKSLKTIVKNKKQFNLSTWHGNPIKKIGRDLYGNRYLGEHDFYSTTDVLICGCQYVNDIFSHCFKGVPLIMMTGTPRCDTMFKINNIEQLKLKLSIPSGKKVLLYAPTFRYSPLDSGVNQIKSLDISRLLKEFSDRFGGEWIIIFRVHNSVLKELAENDIFNRGDIYNGNIGDDMMEYMQVADAMITDYSGAIFDYTHTFRPCFLFALDKKHYIEEERGVYMDIEDLPYDFAENPNQLYELINNYNAEEQRKRIIKFNAKIGNVEKGNASEHVADIIVERLSI